MWLFSTSPESWGACCSTAVSTELLDRARRRLDVAAESQWPTVHAWRQAFTAMGLSPTTCRSASEALLRRIRTQDVFPRAYPLIDLCNAASAAHGIPVAVLDADRIRGSISVTHAVGNERYEPFSGDTEHPAPGEVVYRDEEGWAHARRWRHRQSRRSSVNSPTTHAIVVAEALHAEAAADLEGLVTDIAGHLRQASVDVALRAARQPRPPCMDRRIPCHN